MYVSTAFSKHRSTQWHFSTRFTVHVGGNVGHMVRRRALRACGSHNGRVAFTFEVAFVFVT